MFFSLFSFLLVGCGSYVEVDLGEAHKFTNESVFCKIKDINSLSVPEAIRCWGSANTKVYGGSTFKTEFRERNCVSYRIEVKGEKYHTWRSNPWDTPSPGRRYYTELTPEIICRAADQLGKISRLKTREVFNEPIIK